MTLLFQKLKLIWTSFDILFQFVCSSACSGPTWFRVFFGKFPSLTAGQEMSTGADDESPQYFHFSCHFNPFHTVATHSIYIHFSISSHLFLGLPSGPFRWCFPVKLLPCSMFLLIQTNKQTPWSESASELYRPSDRRLSAKWLPTFAKE
jgi:hypothetical protein